MAPVTHIVLFQFREGSTGESVQAVCQRLLALKANCIHPTSQKPYILSLTGGENNSPEPLQGGLSHGFVVEFASVEDRDYYVNSDPNHRRFVEELGDLVEQVRVLDFVNGVF